MHAILWCEMNTGTYISNRCKKIAAVRDLRRNAKTLLWTSLLEIVDEGGTTGLVNNVRTALNITFQ